MNLLKLKLDTLKNNYQVIELLQGYTYDFDFAVQTNGVDSNLTGVLPSLELLRGDKTFIIQTNNISISGSKVSGKINKGFTSVDGICKLQLILKKDEDVFGSWVVECRVKPSAINQNIKQFGNEVTLIEQLKENVLLAQVENERTEELIENGGVATKGDIAEVNSSLETNTQHLSNSKYTDGLTIYAHRGNMSVAPENTLPSVFKAKDYEFVGVELDIRTTKDGVLVLMHDDSVDRMTNGVGNVNELTLNQIRSFNVDSGNNIELYDSLKVPTLEEALQVVKKEKLYAMLHVYGATASTLLSLIDKYRLAEKIIISSFYFDFLKSVREINKSIQLSFITYSYDEDFKNKVKELGNCFVAIGGTSYTLETVNEIHNDGFRVVTDSCTNLTQYQNIKAKNVDMLLSDIPVIGGV